MVCKFVLTLCAVPVDVEQHLDYLHITFQMTTNMELVSLDQCMDVQAAANTASR